jgi:hypothetical protein
MKPMKRALLCLGLLGVAAVLGGCPIYSSTSDYRVCDSTGCYDCPDPAYSSLCVPWACSSDSDCGGGIPCNGGQCVPGTSPTSDCSVTGCPGDQICRLSAGVASCVSLAAADAGSGEDATSTSVEAGDATGTVVVGPEASTVDAQSTADGASGSDVTSDVASPDVISSPDAAADASTGAEAGPAPVACNADGDCSLGSSCIDGLCAPQSQLCSDGSQCAVSGYACVNGLCVPHCSSGGSCPAGYQCNFARGGVCSTNPAACTGSGTSSCLGGTVCVEGHCVSPCTGGDAGASCPAGQLCINGGCLPDQAAVFECKNDGALGQLANSCDPASVCLHHSCYVPCDGDGGGCAASSCKQVTVHAGTYAACGTPTTLGSQCDWAVGSMCSGGALCVDGYCN